MARSRIRSPRGARAGARSRKSVSAAKAKPLAKASPLAATTGTAPGPGALPPIDCVIVLMQEIRTFDHLFG
jgi:phospholipase C